MTKYFCDACCSEMESGPGMTINVDGVQIIKVTHICEKCRKFIIAEIRKSL